MLSRTAEYAVRAVVVLARNHGRPLSAGEIASILGAPRNYLSKTLSTLARRGILTSTRGPGGGYALATAPGSLSVADIADVFADSGPEHARCLMSDVPCDPQRPCVAHRRWVRLTTSAREVQRRTAIGELCGEEETATDRSLQQDEDHANNLITKVLARSEHRGRGPVRLCVQPNGRNHG